MLLTEKNNEAIVFNVGKKFAQLNKVIVIFQGEEEDRLFLRQQLYNRYDPRICDVMNKYGNKITDINQKVQKIKDDSNQKFKKFYTLKYENKKTDFKESIAHIASKANSQIEKQNDSIQSISTIIQNINEELETKFNKNAILQQSVELTNRLKQKKIDSKKNFQSKLDDLNQKTEKKLSDYKNESKQKLINLRESYKQKIVEFTKESSKEIQQLENKYFTFLKTSKIKIQNYSEKLINQSKSCISQFNAEHKIMFQEKKEKIYLLIKEINKSKEENDHAYEKHRKEVKKIFQNAVTQSKKEKSEFDAKKQSTNEEFSIHKKDLDDLIKKNKSEFEVIKGKVELKNQDLQAVLKEISKQLTLELEEKQDEIDRSQKQVDLNLNQTMNNVEKQKHTFQNQQNQLKNQLEINQSSNQQIKNEKQNQFLSEKVALLDIQKRTIQKINDQISQKNLERESYQKEYQKEINNLAKSKNELVVLLNKRVEENLFIHKQTFDNQKSQYQIELTKVRAEEENNFKTFTIEQNNLIEAKTREIHESKEQFVTNLQSTIKHTIESIEKDKINQNNNSINHFVSTNQQIENELLSNLQQFSDESGNGQIQIQKMDEEIQKLQENLTSKIDSTKNEKEQLINQSKQSIDNENKRHFSVLTGLKRSSTVNGRNTRQQFLNGLKNKINKTIETRESMIDQLTDEKANLEQEMINIKTQFNCQTIEIIEQSNQEEEKLKYEIDQFEENSIDLIENKQMEKAKFVTKKQKEIEKLRLYYIDQKDEMYTKNSMILNTFNDHLVQLKERYYRSTNLKNSQFSSESNNNITMYSTMACDHFQTEKVIQAQIQNLRESNKREKLMLDDKLMRKASHNYEKLKQMQSNYAYQLQKLRNDTEGMNGFLDERIEVLETKLAGLQKGYKERKPRLEEARIIDQLQKRLTQVTATLSIAKGDLKRCQSIANEQERRTNQLIGGHQEISVYSKNSH